MIGGMPESVDIAKLIAWRNSLTEEARQRYLDEHWHIIEELRSLPGEPPTDEEWADFDREFRRAKGRTAESRR